jgi:hypothetical protein
MSLVFSMFGEIAICQLFMSADLTLLDYYYGVAGQGTLTHGEGSVQLTSSLR